MKKLIISLFLFTSVMVSSNRPILVQSDPNRNALWDWTQNTTYDLYFNFSGTQTATGRSLPWFSNTSPAYVLGQYTASQIDFTKQMGWTLLWRDFGTSQAQPAQGYPYFVLYNKCRGILRLFIYYPSTGTAYSHGVVTLTISGTPTHLLNFNVGAPFFPSDYTGTTNPTSVSAITNLGLNGWAFADFNLVGYDENISTKGNCYLNFTLHGVNESTLHINGTLALDQILGSSGTSTNIQSVGSDFTNVFSSASKSIGNMAKYATQISNEASKAPVGAWYKAPLTTLANLSNFLPGLSQVVGFVDGVIGVLGGNSNSVSATQPIRFAGDISLSGIIEQQQSLTSFSFPLPGSPSASDPGYAPLDNTPLGVFTLETQPVIEYYCNNLGGYYEEYTNVQYINALKDPPVIKVNTAAGLSLVSSKACLMSYGRPISSYYNASALNQVAFSGNILTVDAFSWSPDQNDYPFDGLALELKFVTNSNTADTIMFLKTYPITYVFNQNIFYKPVVPMPNFKTVANNQFAKPMFEDPNDLQPNHYSLEQNFPNPFNPTTTIQYALPQDNAVSVKVFDIMGREVAVLVNEHKPAGRYSVSFNADKLPSGMYIYKIQAGSFTSIKKMQVVK